MTEHAIQCQLFSWWNVWAPVELRPLMFAIPNGGRRDSITGRRLKDEGVRRGVPDILLASPQRGWHGLFIEMKTEKGKATPEQMAMLGLLCGQGYRAEICKGFDAAKTVIEDFLKEYLKRRGL